MKTKSTTIVKVAKPLVKFGANLAIFFLSFMSIASLTLLLLNLEISAVSSDGKLVFSGYEAWGGVNAFVLSFVLANSLTTYGLLKLKSFMTSFDLEDLLADKTIDFLKKGAILMGLTGLLHSLAAFIVNPNYMLLDLSLATWLLLASFALAYFKRNLATKRA